jgi:hypothetical protein
MNSKLIASHKDFFSKMVVDAVQLLDDDLDINMIGVKKESGGGMEVRKSLKRKCNANSLIFRIQSLLREWDSRKPSPMLVLNNNQSHSLIPRSSASTSSWSLRRRGTTQK